MNDMQINADFDQRVVRPPPHPQDWVQSPMTGVHRYLLDRVGGEIARATSLVRWAPNTQFSSHAHPGDEEIFVLEGMFRDEHGEYPAGSWLRNPRWSRHTPFMGPEGALIYVKVGHLGAVLLAPPADYALAPKV